MLEALRATCRSHLNDPSTSKGRVSTLIVPHDRTWQKPTGILADLLEDSASSSRGPYQGGDGGGGDCLGSTTDDCCDRCHDGDVIDRDNEIRDFISRCAAALVACAPVKRPCTAVARRSSLSVAPGGVGAIAELAGATLSARTRFLDSIAVEDCLTLHVFLTSSRRGACARSLNSWSPPMPDAPSLCLGTTALTESPASTG